MLRKKPSSSRTPQTMKQPTIIISTTTPESSTKSSSGSTSFIASDTKDSCYFPGCKKDANCKCEICIESMNATLDLMPNSTQRSSLTKLSAAEKSKINSRKHFSFNNLSPLTPKNGFHSDIFDESPLLKSTARIGFQEKGGKKKKRVDLGFGFLLFKRILLGFGIFFILEVGVSWMVSGIFQNKLSDDFVRVSGEKLRGLKDLNQRLDFLKNELKSLVNANVTDCASHGSNWVLNQDGLLLNSKCVLYKSISEEVSIWGWPLQTAGLLTTEFSSRSFTILSGRVTEWTNGGIGYRIHKTNSSWRQQKWASSAVQLDAKTWILEYKQSYIMQKAGLVSAALEFIKFRVTREFGKMKQEFWRAVSFGNHPTDLRVVNYRTPT
ncbi:transmembrane signal receptor [Lithospermum erythrorhizon]|uniref:Transmembrane signal receptor n=1 Tax=Lithospermum erythrorhizon TaxID=34254 RepID=A0AAV3RXT6_LITER